MRFDFSLLNDKITSIHKEINDRESNDEHRDEIRRRKIRIIDSECESNNSSEDITEDRKFQMDNMHRIEKYNEEFVPDEKFVGPQVSSNINELLDFLKLFFTNKLINEIMCEINLIMQ
ncbi:uncharacterized protein LOC116186181 [Apis dorsata]|uniref:uncharacterized protein LOC116186181 n=1 Tax=Apis dorsata TaxID=7462 RepID=UPI001293D3B6|nr:uncharacterized protein LOC116186181 [Apis dorsata]